MTAWRRSKIARAGTTGNTVYAAVSSDDYDVTGDRQAVMWDPKYTATAASNDADIVNLNVDVTVGGATITTEYGVERRSPVGRSVS